MTDTPLQKFACLIDQLRKRFRLVDQFSDPGTAGAFAEEMTQPIRDIVGRAPMTMKQFIADHKAMFA